MARKVCVDGLFLRPQYLRSGTGRYLVSLLDAMGNISASLNDLEISVLVPPLSEGRKYELDGHEGIELVPCPAMRFGKLWRLGFFFRFTQAMKSNVLFLPSPLPLDFKPVRTAVTVHDAIPLLFADQFRSFSGRLLRHAVSSSLQRADLIFTDSDYSKIDLVAGCGVPSERIVVTHLGFDSDIFNSKPTDVAAAHAVLNRFGIDGPYVLHVGAIEPRKNLTRLANAYRLLIRRRKDISFHLVLCGSRGWGCDDLFRLIEEPELRGRVILTGAVPDCDLVVLYKAAIGFAMPSLYEGFGLPLLEAMACGVPAMSSNRSCLPEIAGDAAVYFDPESVEELSIAMERLLTDTSIREELAERGPRRAVQFSWEDCARKTLAALSQL